MGLRERVCLVLSSLLISWPLLASEAPAEGHGGGAPAATTPEWVEIQGKLQVLKTKIAAKEATVRELIGRKHHGGGHGGAPAAAGHGHESFEQLKKEHAELLKLSGEYEQLRNVLRFRYPEKGLKGDRKYERVEVKSLEEMENQIGMAGHLQKTFVKIRRQYGAGEAAMAEDGAARVPASQKKKGPAEEPVTVPVMMSR